MSQKNKGCIVALIAALAILVAVVGFEVASFRPSFCANCHRIDHSFWTRSRHADVSCQECHSGRGNLAVVRGRLNQYYMVFAQLTGLYDRPVTAFVNNANCMACHKAILDTPIVARYGIRMRHSDIITAGIRCTQCHNTVAHGKATKNPTAPFMDTCTPCHDGKKASAKCDTCHYKDGQEKAVPTVRVAPWAITHGAKWTKTHGMGNLKTCSVCHTDVFCTDCHGMQLPHGSNWPLLHGKAAVKNQDELRPGDKARSCVGCHLSSFCEGCHQIAMPHPARFLQVHKKEYARHGKAVCMNCHIQTDCDECHVLHTHPGKLRDPLLQKGVER